MAGSRTTWHHGDQCSHEASARCTLATTAYGPCMLGARLEPSHTTMHVWSGHAPLAPLQHAHGEVASPPMFAINIMITCTDGKRNAASTCPCPCLRCHTHNVWYNTGHQCVIAMWGRDGTSRWKKQTPTPACTQAGTESSLQLLQAA